MAHFFLHRNNANCTANSLFHLKCTVTSAYFEKKTDVAALFFFYCVLCRSISYHYPRSCGIVTCSRPQETATQLRIEPGTSGTGVRHSTPALVPTSCSLLFEILTFGSSSNMVLIKCIPVTHLFVYFYEISGLSWFLSRAQLANKRLHYENMPMQYIENFFSSKNWKFHQKMFDIFLIFPQNIACEYSQSMFWSKNKKNRYRSLHTPVSGVNTFTAMPLKKINISLPSIYLFYYFIDLLIIIFLHICTYHILLKRAFYAEKSDAQYIYLPLKLSSITQDIPVSRKMTTVISGSEP